MRKVKFIDLLNRDNSGKRTIQESIPVPEVNLALKEWVKVVGEGILIGGCAVDFYTKPRMTMNIDFLFLSLDEIPSTVTGFKRTRNGAFQHNKTHVEVEIITPQTVNISQLLVKKVYETSIINSGIKIASPSGLVALKLKRLKRHDIGDIVDLTATGKVDLNGWPLTKEDLDNYNEIISKYS